VGARFLDDDARAAFRRAVEAIEAASSVEVVVAMRRRSAAHRHANVAVGATVAFVALAAMLFGSHPFSLASILVDPFVVGAVAALAVELAPHVKRALSPRRDRHVARAARALFVDHGIHATRGRTGLLVYISWLERQIALVADLGLSRALPPETLAAAERELTAAMPSGGAAVARVLEALAPRFAAALPHAPDDVNELPDAIDDTEGDEP
jgi:putative membrane protein